MSSQVTDADLDTVVGHFLPVDVMLFRALLEASADVAPGDLAELGVLYGRSAVLLGSYLREGETLTVVDLFGADPGDVPNAAENDSSYPGLTQEAFEANYRRLVGDLPLIVRGLSHTVVDHAAHGSHRFVHVDASHLHANVVRDIESARVLLAPRGILVLDDIREEHTPGVAAAAWQAVLTEGLRPFAISPHKLYATFTEGDTWQDTVRSRATAAGWATETQLVNGLELVRVHAGENRPRQRPAHPARRFVPPILWPAVRRAGIRLRLAPGDD